MKRASFMQFSSSVAEVVFINLYLKDGRSGKNGGFCKHKSSSLYNCVPGISRRARKPRGAYTESDNAL